MRYYSTKAAILCSVLFLIILCFICVFFSSPQVEDSLSKEYLYAFTLASEDDYVNEKEYKENEKKYKINEKINEVRIQDLSISVIKLGISRAHKILHRIAGQQEYPCLVTVEELNDDYERKRITVTEDKSVYTYPQNLWYIAIVDDYLLCYDPSQKAVLYYAPGNSLSPVKTIPLHTESSDEVGRIIVSSQNDAIIYTANAHDIKHQKVYIMKNGSFSYIGTGCLPFVLSEDEICYVSDGLLKRYCITTQQNTTLTDCKGNDICIDASPYSTDRIIYDNKHHFIIYAIPNHDFLGDSLWNDIKILSLDDGSKKIIKFRQYILDLAYSSINVLYQQEESLANEE